MNLASFPQAGTSGSLTTSSPQLSGEKQSSETCVPFRLTLPLLLSSVRKSMLISQGKRQPQGGPSGEGSMKKGLPAPVADRGHHGVTDTPTSNLSVYAIPSLGVLEACSYRSPLCQGARLRCPLGLCFPDEVHDLIENCGYNNKDLITLIDAGIMECDDAYTFDAAHMLQRLYDLWCRSLKAFEEDVKADGPAHWWRMTWRVEIEDDLLDLFPQYWAGSQRFRSYKGHFEAFLKYLERKAASFMEAS